MRVVIDTNHLLRMAAAGERSPLMRHWRRQQTFDLLISLSTLTELRVVLARPETQKYVKLPVGEGFTALIEHEAIRVEPDLAAPTCRDPKDNALIAAAVGGRADFLVTADLDLLDDSDLRRALVERNVRVVTAAEFLASLETSS